MSLTFPEFIKDFGKEFLPGRWDGELHSHICNSHLKFSDSFPKWVNDICHSNIILRGTSYHFSDDPLCIQLETLLDADLCIRAKNCNIKDLIEAATNNAGKKTAEAQLTCWITELRKLAEERAHDTK